MSSLNVRGTTIVALFATASLAGKEGYFYKLDEDHQAVICSAVTDVPDGLIGAVSEDGLKISAIPMIGTQGTFRVKLGAAVTDLRKMLQLRADASAGPDAETGARTLVAVPLETGAADEMIECALLPTPRSIAAGAGKVILSIPIFLAAITGAGDVVTQITPGFAFSVESLDFVVTQPVTTAAKLATLNAEIGATNLTGGAVALTSATCTPLGAKIAGTAITAANVGTAADTLSIEASAVTAFAEGSGVLLVTLLNLDTVNAG